MNKDIYGKTMENLRKRINVKLVNNKNAHQNQDICRTKYLIII